jgi:hypothetical protein
VVVVRADFWCIIIAFLLITFANGTTWKFSLWNSGFMATFLEAGPYPVFLLCRVLLAVVIGLLSTWVSERWVLLDADACSADSVSHMAGRLLYSFRNRAGEYYGGEGFPLGLARSRQLATIVLYSVARPDLNKMAICCLFHRLVIVGRGVTDLDKATTSARSATVQSASQTYLKRAAEGRRCFDRKLGNALTSTGRPSTVSSRWRSAAMVWAVGLSGT